jgi:hypothetical protein
VLRVKRFEVYWKGQGWSSHSGDVLGSKHEINKRITLSNRENSSTVSWSNTAAKTRIDKGGLGGSRIRGCLRQPQESGKRPDI